jgi:peroxiredoxin
VLLQLSAIAAFAVIAGWSWLYWQLLGQNGRILLRVQDLEKRLSQLELGEPEAVGLPLGSRAPDFDLTDLYGKRKALADLRGQSLLLIFFNPGCSFCRDLVPSLGSLGMVNPVPLILSTGDAEQSRRFFAGHKLQFSVLLQQESDVLSAYRVKGTPSGYLIDAEGKVASELALGAERLLALASRTAWNHSLARSKLKRDGFKAGTPAPDFHLPRLDGRGNLSLPDFRGRRLLIVFSSPRCEPCNKLAPQLETFHRRRPDVGVVLISKGELSENQAKVQEHGLSFPVVLQQGWTTSRSYAIFATPAAYLIDEQGIISGDVVVGVEPILNLLARCSQYG